MGIENRAGERSNLLHIPRGQEWIIAQNGIDPHKDHIASRAQLVHKPLRKRIADLSSLAARPGHLAIPALRPFQRDIWPLHSLPRKERRDELLALVL